MVEGVAGLDEARSVRFYGKLNLAKKSLIEPDINEDIICTVLQAILYTHNPEFLFILLVSIQTQNFIIDHEYLILFGG